MTSPIPLSSLTTIPISYASCSLGSPSSPPPLLERLSAISSAGFSAIELSFPDILSHGKTLFNHDISPTDYDELCTIAADVKSECEKRGLGIMMLQPFANFEGWPEGSEGRKDALSRAEGWIRIMKACGTDMLQVGSSDTPLEKLDTGKVVEDLRGLCDMLAEEGFKVAYENWCWSTHAPDWKSVWSIVRLVSRPNIGLCLDTFQTAGGEWGDPTTSSGHLESLPLPSLNARFQKSLSDLTATIPPSKIFLLQISDAYLPPSPLSPSRDKDGLLPRGRWSHDFRPLPYNGGYLPVLDVVRAVLKTGFRGWFSYEVFDGGKQGKGEENVDVVAYARAARNVQDRMMEEVAGREVSEEAATR